jgi:hypothetical protein
MEEGKSEWVIVAATLCDFMEYNVCVHQNLHVLVAVAITYRDIPVGGWGQSYVARGIITGL